MAMQTYRVKGNERRRCLLGQLQLHDCKMITSKLTSGRSSFKARGNICCSPCQFNHRNLTISEQDSNGVCHNWVPWYLPDIHPWMKERILLKESYLSPLSNLNYNFTFGQCTIIKIRNVRVLVCLIFNFHTYCMSNWIRLNFEVFLSCCLHLQSVFLSNVKVIELLIVFLATRLATNHRQPTDALVN